MAGRGLVEFGEHDIVLDHVFDAALVERGQLLDLGLEGGGVRADPAQIGLGGGAGQRAHILALEVLEDLIPSGLPFATSTTGPYHQAGPEKLITFTRSGLTWTFWAMTSVRLESSEGTSSAQGIHSYLTFLMPSQSAIA